MTDADKIKGLLDHVEELELALVNARKARDEAEGKLSDMLATTWLVHEAVRKLIDAGAEVSEAALGYVDLDLLNRWAQAVQAVETVLAKLPRKEQR